MLCDARQGFVEIGFSVDHVALVHDNGRERGDPQAPGVGHALVGVAHPRLQWLAALLEALLNQGRGTLGITGQLRGQFRLGRPSKSQAVIGILLIRLF